MSDRIPGSSWDNPIWHRGWRIYLGEPEWHPSLSYMFAHDDYDGAEDANDTRVGHAYTIDEAMAEIDAIEDDAQAEREEAEDRARMVNVGGHRDGGSAS
jgi:hypothetical protein